MLKRTKGYILLTLIVVTGLASRVSTNTLTGKERNFGVNHLKNSKDALLKNVKNLSSAQLNFKANDSSWSIKECVQHITLAEVELWNWAESVLKQPANPEKRSEIKVSDENILKMVSDRSKKANAPESIVPAKATWKDMEETLDSFKDERNKLIKYLKTTTEDVRSHVTQAQLGHIDAYQIILLISAHTIRHTKQIEEVKAHPQFPK